MFYSDSSMTINASPLNEQKMLTLLNSTPIFRAYASDNCEIGVSRAQRAIFHLPRWT